LLAIVAVIVVVDDVIKTSVTIVSRTKMADLDAVWDVELSIILLLLL